MPRMSFGFPSIMSTRDECQRDYDSNSGLTLWSDVGELHSSGRDEFQRFINVLRLLDSHPGVAVVSSKRRVA